MSSAGTVIRLDIPVTSVGGLEEALKGKDLIRRRGRRSPRRKVNQQIPLIQKWNPL